MQETNCPDRSGLDDAERFRRVWQRVQTPGTERAVVPDACGPEQPAPEKNDAGAAWPDQGSAAFLQQAILQSLGRWASYRQWPRLTDLARNCRQHARRLSAAHFLLTGVRYLPSGPIRPQCWASMAESCRRLFFLEQRAEAAYRAGAVRAEDPGLRAMFHELAGECAIHQQRLRRELEREM